MSNANKESDVVAVVKTITTTDPGINYTIVAKPGIKAHVSHTCHGKTSSLDFEEKCGDCGGIAPARHTFYSQRKGKTEINIPVGFGGFEDATA